MCYGHSISSPSLTLPTNATLVVQVFYELQVKWNINLLELPGLCELYPVLFLTAQHLSPLLVLAFTTDRYVSVCHPFQQERFCSRRRPLTTICALTAIALAINAVQAYFWTYDYENRDCGLRPEVQQPQSVAAGRGRGRAAAPDGTLQGAAFEGRKFGILAFALLQCVSIRFYV